MTGDVRRRGVVLAEADDVAVAAPARDLKVGVLVAEVTSHLHEPRTLRCGQGRRLILGDARQQEVCKRDFWCFLVFHGGTPFFVCSPGVPLVLPVRQTRRSARCPEGDLNPHRSPPESAKPQVRGTQCLESGGLSRVFLA